MQNQYCKKSKIILIVSWILAITILIIGIAITSKSCNKTEDTSNKTSDLLYDGTIETITLDFTKTSNNQKIMYSFTPTNSGTYKIYIYCNSSCSLYVLNNNSQKELAQGEYLAYGLINNASKNVNLFKNNTYYIYIKQRANSVASIQITVTK